MPAPPTPLELALLLLAAAVGAVALARMVRLPPLLGYLGVGVVLAPAAAGWLGDAEDRLGPLAHLGVVFLMFSIGLEFNLGKLSAMRRDVFGLGAAQVALTALAVCLAWALLPAEWVAWLANGDIDWRGALIVGGAVAMSSTALVAKLLAERREVESEHGRRIFAVLLFQDLAVIPLLVLIPALGAMPAGGSASSVLGSTALASQLGWAGLKAAVLLALLLKFGRPLLRGWFHVVARRKSHELFTLNVLLVTLTLAWLTSSFGLSLELGAFVAGVLIAETEYRYQVEEDIKPFRDVLLGLFFITLGLQLDLRVVFEHAGVIALLALVPMAFKFGLVALLAPRFGAPAGTSLRVALWLAQAGEFGFVILAQAADQKLLAPGTVQVAYAAMLVSLLLSPLLLANSDRLLLRVSRQEWMLRALQLQAVAQRAIKRDRHVIICGFGRSGQGVAHVLEAEGVPYMALDLDPDRVREAAAGGETVVYGDCTRRETLQAAGLHRAVALVVTFDDTATALRLLALVRQHAPKLPVMVRAAGDDAEMVRLRGAGATEVVPEVVEGSLMLASHALALAGVPLARVLRRIRDVRDDQYALLRGFFRGADDMPEDAIEREPLQLRAVTLDAGCAAVGLALGEAVPVGAGARVTALRRREERLVDPDPALALQAGDTLVLSGTVEALADAERRLSAVTG